MKLTFLGANHEVTGSCTMLEAAGQRFLIDYGMEQGKNVYENQPLPVAPGEIDFVLITHAHIDHTGLLPLLAHNGFRGRIYATIPTVELCGIMLRDSAHIQEFEAEWKNRKGKRGVKVKKGAVVKNCVLMQDTVVEPNVELDCVVTDKNVKITAGKKLSGTESFPVYVQKNHTV